MLKMLKRTVFIFFIFLFSCKSNQNELVTCHESFLNINIPEKIEEPLSLDTLVSNLDIIFLETAPNCLIGDVYKFIAFQDMLYIQDLRNNALFVFNNKGKFLFKLAKSGRGPGEFHELRDFQIDENADIYILTYLKIMHYSPDGKFIDEFNFNFINRNNAFNLNPTNFIITDDHEYYFWGGTVGIDNNLNGLHYAMYKLNRNKKIKEKYFKIKRKIMGGRRFYKNGDYYYLRPFTDVDTIYKIDKYGIDPAYFIDFGRNSLPENYFPNSFNKQFGVKRFKLHETNYCYNIDNIYETSKFIYFTFFQKRELKNVLYSKESGRVISGRLKLFNCVSPYFFIGVKNEQFVSIIEPYMLDDKLKNMEVPFCFPEMQNGANKIKRLIEVKDTDNPLVFIVELKEF